MLRIARADSGVHAVLLYGAEGAGKRLLAEALAQAWLCTALTPEGACGECPPCTTYERGTVADLLRVVPKGPSSLIHAGAIKPDTAEEDDEVMPVNEFLRTRPLRAANKVVLIESADRMNNFASNALLKTLEEPPSYAKIVLTTAAIGRVFPTIVSRCVTLACELPQISELATDRDWPEHASVAEGSPGRVARTSEAQQPYRTVWELAKRVTTAQPSHALALAEEFRAACEALDDKPSGGARVANVEGLRVLGTALREAGAGSIWMANVAEAHRRVQGNSGMGLVTDALFVSSLLGEDFGKSG